MNGKPDQAKDETQNHVASESVLEEKRLALDWARLRADRQKSAAEIKLKRSELAHATGKKYFELLANPFTLAIVGGFITLMTSIITSHYSTINNLETEREKAEYAAGTEKIRAEFVAKAANQTLQADLIKKFVENSDKKVVRENLKFLVDAGLLPDYDKKISAYLQANPDVAPQVGGSERSEKPVEYVGRGFTVPEFKAYVAGLQFSAWKPEMVVLHSTQSPTLAQWTERTAETSLASLSRFFGGVGFSAGPHLFIDDNKIWVFNPLDKQGIHAPSWNRISIGVEMVGNYDSDPLNDKVRNNTVQAIAILDAALQLNADTLRFHSEDPMSNHKGCPGRNVDKADLVRRIQAALQPARGG